MIAEKYKAMVLVGGPGSGKDIILRTIFKESNVLEINLEQLYKVIQEQNPESFYAGKILNDGCPVVINGSAQINGKIETVRTVLENMGYETKLCIVHTTNDVSKARNDARLAYGLKTISEDARHEKWITAHTYTKLHKGYSIQFDNSLNQTELVESMKVLQEQVNEFFTERYSLDEAVSEFLDENTKKDFDAHRGLTLAKDPPKHSGLKAYHDYNKSKNTSKTKAAAAPNTGGNLESSDGAYLSTESKGFKKFRKQSAASAPTNVQYVGDPQGVGGATADLREEKKSKTKSAKPPAINSDERVGDDQAATTTLGMTGESVLTPIRVIKLRRLREQLLIKSPDGDFSEREIYEDIGLDGTKALYEGRAIVTNKPFRRGDTYSVYVTNNSAVERMDFRNHKNVLQEILETLEELQ